MSSPSGDAVFKITAEMVEEAEGFTDILGDYDDEEEPTRVFRRLSRVLHPDYHAGKPTEARAAAAFAKLATLWEEYKTGPKTAATLVITTRKRTYAMCSTPAYKGEVANLYRAVHQAPDGSEVVSWLKMARSPREAVFVQREALVLRRLQADGHEDFRYGAPTILESFRHRDNAAKVDRQCLVREYEEGLITAADVHAAYPAGLDPRDVAWIWRRLLTVVGWAHQVGVVHGAILPEHIVLHPKKHRVMLVGWGRSVETGGTLTSIPKGTNRWYPAEVFNKQPATEATDIYMATRCMEYLLVSHNIRALLAFARGCTFVRPTDAWGLKDEFTDLIEGLWGRRKYRELVMPTVGTTT